MTVLLLLTAVVLTISSVWSFTVPMPVTGFQDVEGYRAVFFHMPLALAGSLSFLIAAVHGARYLLTRRRTADAAAHAAAETGLVLTLLATITGMIFAKSQWGMAWNWDPRQTSIFFVLLIYTAYLMLRQALPEDPAVRGRLSAAYLILAAAPMLWLVMIYPRTVPASLHPERAPFEAVHWRVVLLNFAGLLGVYALLARLHAGIARLELAREEW